jgi:hypothetical protein
VDRTFQHDVAEKDSSRISVTLSKVDYEEICRLARVKKVSNAWVIRDAVGRYVAEESPLLNNPQWNK